MDRQRYLIPMLALITVWRIALLPTAERCPEEALALLLSKHSALWHLEMGPLLPWLVKLSTWIGGSSEIGVRWMAPMMGFAISVMIWRLIRGIYDQTTAAWTVVAIQVLPAFNVMSLAMTTSIVSTTLLLGFIMMLRMALHRSLLWDRRWWFTGMFLALAMLADWRNGLAWFCLVIAFGGSKRRRHHLFSPGFFVVTAFAMVPLWMFISWNVQLGWPSLEAGESEPAWQVWPNALRWALLISPALAVFLVMSLWQAWRNRIKLNHDEALILAFAIPFAAFDFAWGPREAWPATGFPLWIMLGLGMLAHQSIVLTLSIQKKVLLRSGTLLLAAIQSQTLMRTDFVRYMGVPWALQRQVSERHDHYRHWFKEDPSSQLMGWRQGADVLDKVLASAANKDAEPWFLIARNWPLAVGLDAVLAEHPNIFTATPEHPRIQVMESTAREHPLAVLPRYDALTNEKESYAGHHALYISDDPKSLSPPTTIRRSFDHWEILTIVRIMHVGVEVRTLKIFACYGYKPPDL